MNLRNNTTQNDAVRDSQLLARRALQVQRGAARAAVLGLNDGLVSVLCIILGVAGAGAATGSVVVAGLAGLLAGAVSMAAGEWISVQAQVDLFSGIMKDVRHLLARDRKILLNDLAESLQKDEGQTAEHAKSHVEDIADNTDLLVLMYTRHVMGFNPDELGSPWVAAGSSFVLFVCGALVPLSPWFVVDQPLALWLSVSLTALAGLIVGGYISSSSGGSVWYGALRQLAIIVFAAAATYGIGYLFGVAVS